jgi:hypothetical protein
MEVSGQNHAPAALSPEKKNPGTHWIKGCVDIKHSTNVKHTRRRFGNCKYTKSVTVYRDDKPDRIEVSYRQCRYYDARWMYEEMPRDTFFNL